MDYEGEFNLKRKILSIAIITIMLTELMFTLAGCKSDKPKYTVDEIIQYMSEKYGEEFTYIESVSINQPNAIFVKSSKYSDELIFAKCFIDEDNTKRFCDNYAGIKYKDLTNKYVTDAAKSVYPDSKVRYTVDKTAASAFDDQVLSFDEYISKTSSSINFMIILPTSHDDSVYESECAQLCKILKEKGIVCGFTIAYSKDAQQFSDFNTDDEFSQNHVYKLRGDIRLGEDFSVEYEEWI